MKTKKKILIVGGTGFIGYHLAKKCLKKSWQVTSISSRHPRKIRFLKKIKYICCDITNKKLLKKSINDTLMKFFLIQTKDIKNAKDTMKFLKSNFIKSTDHNTLGMRGALKILGETDLRKDIEKIDKQSLVIVGEKDRLTPLDASIWLNKNIKTSTLIKITGANHMPFISHKEKVISSVINFINDN